MSLGSDLQQPARCRQRGRGNPRAQVELRQDVGHMSMHSVPAQAQLGRDLRVGFALRDLSQDLLLATREPAELAIFDV